LAVGAGEGCGTITGGTIAGWSTGPAKDFRWTWVVAAPKPPSASSSGTLGSGTESALYVSVSAPNPAPADFPASLPSQGTATTVAVRDKTTVDTLTSYVQGIAGFLGAVIALIAGLRNAHKP
jgi:hypothetical protein